MKSYWVSTSQKMTRAMAGKSLRGYRKVSTGREEKQRLDAQTRSGEQSE